MNLARTGLKVTVQLPCFVLAAYSVVCTAELTRRVAVAALKVMRMGWFLGATTAVGRWFEILPPEGANQEGAPERPIYAITQFPTGAVVKHAIVSGLMGFVGLEVFRAAWGAPSLIRMTSKLFI